MFDNHTNPPAGAVPNNLPMGEPDDMFAGSGDVEPALPQPDPINLPPTALDAGVLRPKMGVGPQEPLLEPELPPLAEPMPQMTGGSAMPPRRETVPTGPMPMPANVNSDGVLSAPLGGHKALITVIVLLSVIIIGGGAAWAYFTFINPKDIQVLSNNNVILPVTSTSNNIPETQPFVTSTEDVVQGATSTDSLILFGEPILDTDSDGLDDNVEKEKGTNMLAWDSDGDTLSDGDEVLTWKTNPLKADTDGDTYEDAAEIKNGYNPNGDGKLFAVNTTSTASGANITTSTAEIKP